MEQDIATQVVGLGGATDFSLWKLFLRADFVVKFVIILLIACSIFSWALIFDKFKLFKKINNSIEDFEKKFWKAKSAESFNNNLPVNSKDPAVLIFKSAMSELLKTKRQSSNIRNRSQKCGKNIRAHMTIVGTCTEIIENHKYIIRTSKNCRKV